MRVKKYLPAIFLVVILLVAAYLRLYRISEYLTFLGDEGRDVLVVKRMIVDHKFTLLGPTASVGGFFLGPIYYYFMLPFLWAWKLDPVGPAVMVGLFGIATVYLVYITGKKMFGQTAGLIAASLYAVSPVVIAYSRSSWNPNIVPFFSLLLIYLLWLVATKKRARDGLFVGIVLGIGIQLHYLFLFLFGVVLVWYILERKKIPIVHTFLFTIVGFLAGASGFLAFELRHDFTNTRSIIQFITAGKETGYVTGSFFTIVGDVAFRLFGRLLYRFPQPDVWEKYSLQYINFLSLATWVTLTGCVVYLLSAFKKTSERLLLLWLLAPLTLFGFYHKGIYDYYFGIFFALPFLFVGFIASKALKQPFLKWCTALAVGVLLVFNWQGRPFVYAPNNQLRQVEHIAKTAFDQTQGKPFNFALITGGNSDHAYRYFFEIWGNPPVVIENTQVDPERKSVTDQLIIICEDSSCQPLGHPLWEIAGFGRAEIAGSWEVPFVKIYKMVHYTGK